MGVYSNKRIREDSSDIYFDPNDPNTVIIVFNSYESCRKAEKHMNYVMAETTLYANYVFAGTWIYKSDISFRNKIDNRIVKTAYISEVVGREPCLCVVIDRRKSVNEDPKHTGYYLRNYEAIFLPIIKKVIFNPPATIVIWEDESKTVVKCKEGDYFNKEIGLAICIARKYFGSRHRFEKCVEKYGPYVDDCTPSKDALNEKLSQGIYEAITNVFNSAFKDTF